MQRAIHIAAGDRALRWFTFGLIVITIGIGVMLPII
jgi:hypothetical protein